MLFMKRQHGQKDIFLPNLSLLQHHFRCTFLGTIVSTPVKLSSLLENMRVPLQRCQSRSRRARDTVCCRDTEFLTQKLEDKKELFEEEMDYNFNKIFVYSNKKAPGGR